MNARRIAVVTTTRADYGLLRYLIRALSDDRRAALLLTVGGAHLDPRHGGTIREVRQDGVPIAARVRFSPRTDDGSAVAAAMGEALAGFGRAFKRTRPDVVVVLGDRWEILAAATAASLYGALVAHLCGGEVTAGSLDESWRHAITKIAHLHFPATHDAARRIRAMGEDAWRIKVAGSPGLEAIRREPLLPRTALAQELGIPLRPPLVVATYHPVTTDPKASLREVTAMIQALQASPVGTIIYTGVNADPGSRAIGAAIARAADRDPRAVLIDSLGSRRYLSLLRSADVMVGNSSSGLIEAPSFGLPVVNIGDRQAGRIRAANVLDVPGEHRAIAAAIARGLRADHRHRLRGIANPYGDGRTSARIRSRLLGPVDRERYRMKRFVDAGI